MIVFFEATSNAVVIYRCGEPAKVAVKFSDFVRLSKESLDGLVKVPDPNGGEDFDWVDHPTLLRLSSACALLAAESYEKH